MSDVAVGTTVAAGFAVVLGACALLLARGRAARVLTLGHLLAAVLLAAAAVLAGLAPDVAAALAAVVAIVLVPGLVMVQPDGRPLAGVGVPALVFTVVLGALSVVYPALFLVPGLGPSVAVLVAMVVTWWRYERADGPDRDAERRSVLWVACVYGGCLLLAGLAIFVVDSGTGLLLAAAALVPAPFSLVVAAVRPDVADVRGVVTRAVVEVVALWLVVTVYVALASTLELLRGGAPRVGEAAVLAAVSALVLQPARRVLGVVVERLVFGDRDDPVRVASAVGRTLSGDPVHALDALRGSLALPYAALVDDDVVVAASGRPEGRVHGVELAAGDRALGRLDVGLRPGQVRLDRQDAVVLDVVTPALAQALHARALSRDLHDSRAEVIAAVEDERRRLRHDLHDGLGPTLTGIAFAADAARNTVRADPERSRTLVESLRRDAADAIVEVRRLVDGLRPPAVDELGLVGALRQQVRSLHAADGRPLAVRLEAPDDSPPLPAAVEVATYRIVTEALTNVARHSGSHAADVRIVVDASHVRVDVTDDGAGGPAAWEPGVGLSSMRERAEQLGGTFETTCLPGSGGRVRAAIPINGP